MKVLLTFLFLVSVFFYSSASDDTESVESLTEGREIAPLPQTDERIPAGQLRRPETKHRQQE